MTPVFFSPRPPKAPFTIDLRFIAMAKILKNAEMPSKPISMAIGRSYQGSIPTRLTTLRSMPKLSAGNFLIFF